MNLNFDPAVLRRLAELMENAAAAKAEHERLEDEAQKIAAWLGISTDGRDAQASSDDAVTVEEYAASLGVQAKTVREMIEDGRIGEEALAPDGRIRPWVANAYAVTLSPNGSVAAKLRLKLGHKERLARLAAQKQAEPVNEAAEEATPVEVLDPILVGRSVGMLRKAGREVTFLDDSEDVLVAGKRMTRALMVEMAKRLDGAAAQAA